MDEIIQESVRKSVNDCGLIDTFNSERIKVTKKQRTIDLLSLQLITMSRSSDSRSSSGSSADSQDSSSSYYQGSDITYDDDEYDVVNEIEIKDITVNGSYRRPDIPNFTDVKKDRPPGGKFKLHQASIAQAGRINVHKSSILSHTVRGLGRQMKHYDQAHDRSLVVFGRDIESTKKHNGYHNFLSDKECATPPPVIQFMYGTKFVMIRKRGEIDYSEREDLVHSSVRREQMNMTEEESTGDFWERVEQELAVQDRIHDAKDRAMTKQRLQREQQPIEKVGPAPRGRSRSIYYLPPPELRLSSFQPMMSTSRRVSMAQRRESLSKKRWSIPLSMKRWSLPAVSSPGITDGNLFCSDDGSFVRRKTSHDGSIATYRIRPRVYPPGGSALFKCGLRHVRSPLPDLSKSPTSTRKESTSSPQSVGLQQDTYNARLCSYKLAPKTVHQLSYRTGTLSTRQREADIRYDKIKKEDLSFVKSK